MERSEKNQQQKQRIEEAFRNPRPVEVIPPNPKVNFRDPESVLNVCAYCRVSTLSKEQAESYALQKEHYDELIESKPGWKNCGIYADEGVSGTSVKHREHFLEMIEDCKAGKIDFIITKSVSRFARNAVDCLTYTRMLKSLPRPVGVYFETQGIDTLTQQGETMLTFLAGVAQQESEDKSNVIKWGIRQRFAKGIPKFAKCIGYRKVDEVPVIQEEEASVVRLIYDLFLQGNPVSRIAKLLNAAKKKR